MAWIAWDYQEYAAYIKKSGPMSASTNLLQANFMPYLPPASSLLMGKQDSRPHADKVNST